MTFSPDTEIIEFGEQRFLININGPGSVEEIAAHANRLAQHLRAVDGILESISGLSSVCISFDPSANDTAELRDTLVAAINSPIADLTTVDKTNIIEIPVCYDPQFGLDLHDVANHTGLSVEEIIERHATTPLPVLMIGFAPGFAYLGPVDETIRMPRLENPRPRVDPGAVGIAGQFTGVYPLPSPGGWRIIGRTPMPLFYPDDTKPFVLQAGATVKFKPISRDEFDQWAP